MRRVAPTARLPDPANKLSRAAVGVARRRGHAPGIVAAHPGICHAIVDASSLILAGVFAAVLALASSALALLVLVRLPPRYFVEPRRDFMKGNHPLLRAAGILAKNLFGIILIVAGIAMSLPAVPGPGIVTLLVGLALLDFPGKRALERRAIRQRRILAAVNALRRRFSAPPLIVDESDQSRTPQGSAAP